MISAVVLTKDEEKNIGECLKGLRWCEEVIVIDDYSEDGTGEIAKKLGAKVFKRHLNNDFAAQRNFGLEKAEGDWVLFVDADERVTNKLADEIKQVTQKSAYARNCVNGFFLRRKDFIFGKWLKHGETANIRLLRLARKGSGEWKRKVHETWEIKGKASELKNSLLHYSHPTINDFLKQINFHSTLHAEALRDEGVRPSLFRLVTNPLGKFIQNYIFKFGFLDGTPGFIVAMMMSFHSFLSRAKLYFKQ